jgi:hypothetical protein
VAGQIGSAVCGGGDVRGWLLTGFEWSRLRHRDLIGAGCRVRLEAVTVAVVDVAADHMEDSGHRDGERAPRNPNKAMALMSRLPVM